MGFDLVKATQGKRSRGWPGDARKKLAEWGLVLKISAEGAEYPIEKILLDCATKNYHIKEIEFVLRALHNKWIKLVRKDGDLDDEAVIGGEGPA
jgi:hypothetical protein